MSEFNIKIYKFNLSLINMSMIVRKLSPKENQNSIYLKKKGNYMVFFFFFSKCFGQTCTVNTD